MLNFEKIKGKELTKSPQKSAKTDVDVIFNVQETHQQHPAKSAQSRRPQHQHPRLGGDQK